MSSATLTLNLPNCPRVTTLTLTRSAHVKLSAAMAQAIRDYASRKGVSALAVEYSVSGGRV